jgi:hypothetical protein
MPIASLLANTAFGPEMTSLLASAFETAWEKVKKSDSPLASDAQTIRVASKQELKERIIAAIDDVKMSGSGLLA